jgi:hypothetical protein
MYGQSDSTIFKLATRHELNPAKNWDRIRPLIDQYTDTRTLSIHSLWIPKNGGFVGNPYIVSTYNFYVTDRYLSLLEAQIKSLEKRIFLLENSIFIPHNDDHIKFR